MPNRQMPRKPSRPNSSIGNMPRTNTGNSGSSSNVSDVRDRIIKPVVENECRRTNTRRYLAVKQGEIAYACLQNLAGCHARADFGAQFVDQFQAFFRLDMPKGPAIA